MATRRLATVVDSRVSNIETCSGRCKVRPSSAGRALFCCQNGTVVCLLTRGTHHPDPCPRPHTGSRVLAIGSNARPPRLGLIGAHLDRQVSSTAARCPPPPATPAQSQRPCRTRASCTACRHHGRASATMCATSAPPTRSSQVGGNCRRPRSPQSSARASVAITSPPRLLRRLTDGISAK